MLFVCVPCTFFYLYFFYFCVVGPINWAGSSINMLNRNVAEEVIPELDENLTTIISMREKEKKPTVQDIFGPNVSNAPPASKPIDVPKTTAEHRPPPTISQPLFTRNASEPGVMTEPSRRPTTLSTSVPLTTTTRPKFELFPVSPDMEDGSRDDTETHPGMAAFAQHEGLKTSISQPEISALDDDDDDDEDERLRSKNRNTATSSDSLAKKLAKTFGMKDKSGEGDEKAEVHLLSDVSGSRDDDDSSSSP